MLLFIVIQNKFIVSKVFFLTLFHISRELKQIVCNPCSRARVDVWLDLLLAY